MLCPKCGANLDDGSKACSACGAAIAESAAPAAAGIPAAPFDEVLARIKGVNGLCDCDGRARRGDFWVTYLLTALPVGLVGAVLYGIAYAMFGGSEAASKTAGYIFALSQGAAALAFLAVLPPLVRRTHDLGLSGWVAAGVMGSAIIPVVGPFVAGAAMLAIGCIPGKKGANEYGADPLEKAAAPAAVKKEPLVCAFWAIAVAAAAVTASLNTFTFMQTMIQKMSRMAF